MRTQQKTGDTTEKLVQQKLESLGFLVEQGPDKKSVDLVVAHPDRPNTWLNIQVKGRGKTQTNERYRWFQLRMTERQRLDACEMGLSLEDAWRPKVDKCDFFILVSLKHNELWVFHKDEVAELIELNKTRYGNWTEWKKGIKVEMDLDIEVNGTPLTTIFKKNKNNFDKIETALLNSISS